MGHGVSACATCDGFFFKEKELVVVGGGDTAMEEATFLTKFASKVTVVHRRDELRASKIMQERARKNPKIAFVWDSVVDEIHGDRRQGAASPASRSKNVKTGAHHRLHVRRRLHRHRPPAEHAALRRARSRSTPNGYIVTKNGTTYTSVAGVFACGDVQDHVYRQAVTAAGSGCMAAIDAERWLEAQHG